MDNLIATALNAGAGYADLMRLANHGGQIDNAINVYGPLTTHLFRFGGTTAGSFVGVDQPGGSTVTFTNWRRISVDVEGTTYYMIAARTIT